MVRDRLEEQRRRSEMTTAQQLREDRVKNLLDTIARSKAQMYEQGIGALIKISMPSHIWDDISWYLNLGIAARSPNNARLMGAELEITYRPSHRFMELGFESGHRHTIPVYQPATIYPSHICPYHPDDPWADLRTREESFGRSRITASDIQERWREVAHSTFGSEPILNEEALNRMHRALEEIERNPSEAMFFDERELTNERTRAQIPAPDKIPTY